MKRQNGKGLALYEQVLQKNFEIIETFLNKFPSIFKKQDFFQESIRKINEKLEQYDGESGRIRDQLQLSVTMLDKKITTVKEQAPRKNRASQRASQEVMSPDDRKSTFFRVNSIPEVGDSGTASSAFTKQKEQALAAVEKKQQEAMKRIDQMNETVEVLKEKYSFVSVLNGKLVQQMDHVLANKSDKSDFQHLSSSYKEVFLQHTETLVAEKYVLGSKMIDSKVRMIEQYMTEYIDKRLNDLKVFLLKEMEKKAGISHMKEELSEMKHVIEKIVEESVESFASKPETKQSLLLFERKCSKLEMATEEILKSLASSIGMQQCRSSQLLTTACRRSNGGVMSSFGRKRKVHPSETHESTV